MSYIYSLALCQPDRHELVCPHLALFEEEVDNLKVPPWWHNTEQKDKTAKKTSKWPDKPQTVVYHQVHKCDENAPWCIYVLEHKDFVAASSLGKEDLPLFDHRDVVNNELFRGCTLSDANKSKIDGMRIRVSKQIKLYARVVPYPLIREKIQEVERGLMKDMESSDLRKKIIQSDNTSAVVEMVERSLTQQRLRILTLIQEIKDIETLDVKKEIQQNDWFTEFLEGELHGLGFLTTKEFPYNKFSIFGRSRPDFAFFKLDDAWIKVGIILQPEMVNINLYGASAEFKMDLSEDFNHLLPQAFADMVRVASNMLIDSLKRGKVVDTITIYGLLVSYNKEFAIP